jgi:transposase-like protein
MSHTDHTLQEGLEQHLQALKAGQDPNDWLCDLVAWLLQKILDLGFKQILGAVPYKRSLNRQGYQNGYY